MITSSLQEPTQAFENRYSNAVHDVILRSYLCLLLACLRLLDISAQNNRFSVITTVITFQQTKNEPKNAYNRTQQPLKVGRAIKDTGLHCGMTFRTFEHDWHSARKGFCSALATGVRFQ